MRIRRILLEGTPHLRRHFLQPEGEPPDKLIVADLFGDHPSDTLATLEEGMQAVLVAAAINESLATHGPVQVQPLLNN